MPGKGKHRRPKSRSLSRGFVAAGTGGAAIALPLMGAAGAHAADKAAPAAAPAVAPQKAAAAPAASTAQKPAAPTSYRVVAGDYLSKIAAEHDVRGGWQKLYADNRAAVGDDPALIHPGLKLTIGAKAQEQPAEKPARKAAPAKPKASDNEDRASRSESRESGTAAKASTSDAAESAPQENASGYSAPLDSAAVTTPYRASGAMWSSGYHTGIDFAASTGTTVKSVGPGSVVSAGWSGAYGNEVVIQHTDGTYSQYAHLSSLTVSAGQNVSGGQQIGLSGSTGNSSGPHLHFEIRTGPSYGSDMDPVSYLRQYGVSL
ncbi:LysM peptidoglycan-binding domain-containing M23 family metallopeptidase [Streptomyces sp. AM8-1-1]|uniref:M23 family metallopeptidase n=1 Tax=Streptomyces sp. AM8-1-1 TaxID=3075825 RepID=UPI0028C3D57B|nr:LysM peptidoglycan-binding domain-containing M23 family metallopeptidase [Streptomyces sp. AM8-1-1]WNO71096.1 LysM peptidoglycan-binding domain-containing M23 family metallopeptidase [Streptomyces sp. AM8-1-1]